VPLTRRTAFPGLDPADRSVFFKFTIMDQTPVSKRILVIDDNNEAADITAELLELHGYTTAVAYAGMSGLEAARNFAPHAILMDLGMPGMDGYQVAAALRALPDFDHVALVAFTAWGDLQTRQRVVSTGFDDHVVKPASLGKILAALTQSLARREQAVIASNAG